MEKIKKQMCADFKFINNEGISPHFPITQAGLVQLGWKKNLKVDHPVDVSFMSEFYGKNDFGVVKCSNASFTIEPKDGAGKKVIINDGAKVNNIILIKNVPNKSKLKEEKKTYKSCDNFPLHGTEVEYSFEGDNYETIKIKEDKYGGKLSKETKRDNKKEKYERYEDLSSDWEVEEEEEDDEMEASEHFAKYEAKAAKGYLLEGFKSILNPEIGKYNKGYELDEEEDEEKEESVDEGISALFKEEDAK